MSEQQQPKGNLYTRCRKQWGLTPEEVNGLLGMPREFTLGEINQEYPDPEAAYQQIRERITLASGRVLLAESSLEIAVEEAERRAWEALARYKFADFGMWATIWSHQNRVGGFQRPNPFGELVDMGRRKARPAREDTR